MDISINTNTKARVQKEEKYYRKKNGEYFYVEATYAIIEENLEINYYLVNWMDITQRKKLEKQVLEISEKERNRIGNDLHDGIGQNLTGISYLFKVLMNKISNRELPEKTETEKIMTLMDETKNNIKMLSKGLSIISLEKKGIIAAVKELCKSIEDIFSIKCNFIHGKKIGLDNLSTEIHIYYIIQESLNNAIKHGKSSNINIKLFKKNKILNIEIEDDGTGFDMEMGKGKGMGLDLMKYRSDIIGCELEVKKGDQYGTAINSGYTSFQFTD